MKKRYPFIRAVMIVVYAFIFLPIFIVALMSFNASQYGTFPFVFSTKWYVRLFTGASLGVFKRKRFLLEYIPQNMQSLYLSQCSIYIVFQQ